MCPPDNKIKFREYPGGNDDVTSGNLDIQDRQRESITIVNFNHSGIAVLPQDNIWTGNTVRCVVISMGKNSNPIK